MLHEQHVIELANEAALSAQEGLSDLYGVVAYRTELGLRQECVRTAYSARPLTTSQPHPRARRPATAASNAQLATTSTLSSANLQSINDMTARILVRTLSPQSV